MKKILIVSFGFFIVGALFITQIYAQRDLIQERYAVGGEILPIIGTNLLLNPITLIIMAIILTGIVIIATNKSRIDFKK
jgi:hypothetical protein